MAKIFLYLQLIFLISFVSTITNEIIMIIDVIIIIFRIIYVVLYKFFDWKSNILIISDKLL